MAGADADLRICGRISFGLYHESLANSMLVILTVAGLHKLIFEPTVFISYEPDTFVYNF
jgi:hypothetical protein